MWIWFHFELEPNPFNLRPEKTCALLFLLMWEIIEKKLKQKRWQFIWNSAQFWLESVVLTHKVLIRVLWRNAIGDRKLCTVHLYGFRSWHNLGQVVVERKQENQFVLFNICIIRHGQEKAVGSVLANLLSPFLPEYYKNV